MNANSAFAAQLLETSAAGYAAAAAARLSGRQAAAQAESTAWQAHLVQRVLELAAAVRVHEPPLFLRRVAWLRRAAIARMQDDSSIAEALESLRETLRVELPEAVRRDVVSVLDEALAEFDRPPLPDPELTASSTADQKLALEYLAACLEGEPERPLDIIRGAVENGLSLEGAYCAVLLPAQKEIGRLWHSGDVSVAEERLVTETTRRVMAWAAARRSPVRSTQATVVAASVSGDAHDIGLRAAADLFLLAGWRCLYLGSNVPAADLAEAARTFRADLVVLTATLITQLGALADTVTEVRKRWPTARVLVGGPAFEGSDDLWKKLGADGFAACVSDAVERGSELLRDGDMSSGE
jgi:MerR family transcriptional regulator, light-induced transcriptional regulator